MLGGLLPGLSTGLLPSGSAGLLQGLSTGLLPSGSAGLLPSVSIGLLPSVATGLLPSLSTGLLPSMSTGLLPGGPDAAVFATAVLVLNATPGVDFLLTVTRTLQGGVRAGVAAALGISAGCVVHGLAAAFGLAALLALHPHAFRAIQWAGAAYLLWLGAALLLQACRHQPVQRAQPAQPAAAAAAPRRWQADFRAGLLTNLLNPKVALFFLAFLPQFVPAGSPAKTASFLLLGAWFVLQGTLFLLLLVTLAARLARWQTRPLARRLLAAGAGGLFVALALRLLKTPAPTA